LSVPYAIRRADEIRAHETVGRALAVVEELSVERILALLGKPQIAATLAIDALEAVLAPENPQAVDDILRIADVIAVHAIFVVHRGEYEVAVLVPADMVAIFRVYQIVGLLKPEFRRPQRELAVLLEKRLREIVLPPALEPVPAVAVEAFIAIDLEGRG
jgi:hypothetical protein